MIENTDQLSAADRVLLAGHLTGAISVLLLSIGTILRLSSSLPTTPLFSGAGTNINPTQPTNTNNKSGSGYWDR